MSQKQYIKAEVLEIVFLIIYVVIIIGLFSLFFGFGLGGFDRADVFEKNNFYIPYGIAFLLGLVAIKVAGIFLFKQKDSSIEGSIIHDPDQTPLGNFKLVNNPFLLIFFSIIFFSILGWLFTSQQTFFNQVPQFEQQFTVGADLFFGVYPASPSETLGALFVISLFGLLLGLFAKRAKLKPVTFWISFVFGGTVLSAIFGIINHMARYGFSDVAITNVAIFWGVGGLITTLTGSVIPFLFMHDINNFFVKLSTLFSQDIVTFITFTIIGIMTLVFVLVFIRVRKKKNVKVKFDAT